MTTIQTRGEPSIVTSVALRFGLVDGNGYEYVDVPIPTRVEWTPLFLPGAEGFADRVVGFRIRILRKIRRSVVERLDGQSTTFTLRFHGDRATYGAHFDYVTWNVDENGKLSGLAEYVSGPSSHPKLRAMAPNLESSLFGLFVDQ